MYILSSPFKLFRAGEKDEVGALMKPPQVAMCTKQDSFLIK